MKKNLAMVCTSVLMGCSGAGADSYVAPQNKPLILNGYPGSVEKFPAIGALVYLGGTSELCTVSIIKKDLALTAAHCVDDYIDNTDVIKVLYDKDEVFKDSCQTDCQNYLYDIAAAKIHPQFDDLTETENHRDFALLLLKREIPNAKPINFLSPDDFNTVLRVGDYVTIAGYGIYWKSSVGEEKVGKLFAAQVPITDYRNPAEIIVGEKNPTKGAACYGDSGGPIYVYAYGEVQLSGVASRLVEAEDGSYQCGQGSIYGLPELEREWIDLEYKKLREKYPLEKPSPAPEENKDTKATGGFSCQMSSESASSTLGIMSLLLAGYVSRRKRK